LQIAFLVDPLICPRPQTEFFPIIRVCHRNVLGKGRVRGTHCCPSQWVDRLGRAGAIGKPGVWTLSQSPEKGDQVFRKAERNEVAQLLADWKQSQWMAFALGQIVSAQRVRAQSGLQKMR